MRKTNSQINYTRIIIIINVAVFILATILSIIFGQTKIYSLTALMPSIILSGKNLWTLITSMFMHGSVAHLLMNMISLSFIGSFVEKLIGKKRFLRLYVLGGLFAGILFILIASLTKTDLNVYALGASGAIFALGGLLVILTPKLPVMVFFVIPLPMWAAMLFLMFGLWAVSLSLGLPIGNTAHLGGLIVGLAYGLILKKKYPNRAQMISRYFTS